VNLRKWGERTKAVDEHFPKKKVMQSTLSMTNGVISEAESLRGSYGSLIILVSKNNTRERDRALIRGKRAGGWEEFSNTSNDRLFGSEM